MTDLDRLPNCLEQLDAYWAVAKTGLVVVAISPLLQEAGRAVEIRRSARPHLS